MDETLGTPATHPPADDRTGREGLTRRDFVALSVAAGLAALPGGASAATDVTESSVSITTPDGSCDAAFLHPASGRHPAVLLWTDALGLRPAKRAMARRLAAEGFAVLVPNPYYRSSPAPQFDSAKFSFQNTEDRARLMPLMQSLAAADLAERDARAYFGFLDAQAVVDTRRLAGVHGYCMGGRLSFRTAAALPERIGAVGSFHGGGLVTDKPDSPHLLLARSKARYYIGISSDDDAAEPQAKDTLRTAFADADLQAEIEVYAGALHGWCVPDMPARNGTPVYNEPGAEKAWGKLLALYRGSL
jgi:carboxymethylenebutenolidase